MSKSILLNMLAIILFSKLCFAQQGIIPLSVDYSFYRGSERKIYSEIYLSFFQNHLQYKPVADKFRAEYTTAAKINQNDTIIDQRTKKVESFITSRTDIRKDRQFVDVFGFELHEGIYQVRLSVQDENSGSRGEYIFDINPSGFGNDSLTLSDIELASNIARAEEESDFNKNTLQVIPNPSNYYSITLPMIYYYAELYNLDFNSDAPGKYQVKCSITNSKDEIVKQFPDQIKQKPGESAVLIGGHNIVTLPEDVYFLNLEVFDQESKISVEQSKRFIFHKPDAEEIAGGEKITTIQGKSEDLGEYEVMSEIKMDKEFEYAKVIASDTEQEVYKTLNIEGKRKFLREFWKRKRKENNQLTHFYKQDYLERVLIANKTFGSGKLEGWKSDRGRVFLVYGPPNELERHYHDLDKKPHEIWHFDNLEGGVIFVFADVSGFGEFELLHSTYSQELHNPAWERLVKRAESTINPGAQFDNSF